MNATMTRTIGAALAAMAAFVSAVAHADPCTIQLLKPTGSSVQVAGAHAELGEPDDAAHPQAWRGPITLGSCLFDVDIIEGPLALTSHGDLIVPTYSGSERVVYIFTPRTCRMAWKSDVFFGRLKIGRDTMQLGEQHYALDAHCLPKRT